MNTGDPRTPMNHTTSVEALDYWWRKANALEAAIKGYLDIDDRLPEVKPEDMPTAEWDALVAEWQERRDALSHAIGKDSEHGRS